MGGIPVPQTGCLHGRPRERNVLMAKFYYGGQAVMEGVMMRGRTSAAVAIRRAQGSIYLYEEALNPRLYKNRLFRLPFLRGAFLLWEMLVLGTRLMTFSANIATGALDPGTSAATSQPSGTDTGGRPEADKSAVGAINRPLRDPDGVDSSAQVGQEVLEPSPQIGGVT